MQGGPFGGGERLHKGIILFLCERAVDVIARALPVPIARESAIKIDAVRRDDGRGSVVKVQRRAEFFFDVFVERPARQRARCDDARFGQRRHFLADDMDVRAGAQFFRDIGGELFPVDGERPARRHPRNFRRRHRERAQPPHLLFQEPAGVAPDIVALQGIGADELAEVCALVRGGEFLRLHVDKFDFDAAAAEIIRRFAPRKPRADDADHALPSAALGASGALPSGAFSG